MSLFQNPPTVAFLHTFPLTVRMVEQYAPRYLPDFRVVHIMDDSLRIYNNRAPLGEPAPEVTEAYLLYAERLQKIGCRAAFSCCGFTRSATRIARQTLNFPIHQIDDPLYKAACDLGGTIGLFSINPRVIPHAMKSLEHIADRTGKAMPAVIARVCEAAMQALSAGDEARHDALLLEDVASFSCEVDGMILTQGNFGLLEDDLFALSLPSPVWCAGSLCFTQIAKSLAAENGEDSWIV